MKIRFLEIILHSCRNIPTYRALNNIKLSTYFTSIPLQTLHYGGYTKPYCSGSAKVLGRLTRYSYSVLLLQCISYAQHNATFRSPYFEERRQVFINACVLHNRFSTLTNRPSDRSTYYFIGWDVRDLHLQT